jgi:acetyltransferase-like isoleucine patch superfamily enzyme
MSSSNPSVKPARSVYVHPAAIVESQAIGDGTRVWAFTHVMAGATIGADCNVGEHCFIEGGATVGDGVTIKNGNMLWEGVTVEEGVFVGPAVVFTNDRYPRSPRMPQARERYNDHGWLAPTTVRRGATLGAGAIILAGISIGEYSMIAAGAVVTRDVAPYALVVGNPGRVRGWVCQCGQPLSVTGERATCGHCGLSYSWDGTSLLPG